MVGATGGIGLLGCDCEMVATGKQRWLVKGIAKTKYGF